MLALPQREQLAEQRHRRRGQQERAQHRSTHAIVPNQGDQTVVRVKRQEASCHGAEEEQGRQRASRAAIQRGEPSQRVEVAEQRAHRVEADEDRKPVHRPDVLLAAGKQQGDSGQEQVERGAGRGAAGEGRAHLRDLCREEQPVDAEVGLKQVLPQDQGSDEHDRERASVAHQPAGVPARHSALTPLQITPAGAQGEAEQREGHRGERRHRRVAREQLGNDERASGPAEQNQQATTTDRDAEGKGEARRARWRGSQSGSGHGCAHSAYGLSNGGVCGGKTYVSGRAVWSQDPTNAVGSFAKRQHSLCATARSVPIHGTLCLFTQYYGEIIVQLC